MVRRKGPALLAFVAFVIGCCSHASAQQTDYGWLRFEQYLEALRQQTGIPGLSAVILKDQQIVWERGLGFQSIENAVRATPDTAYHVAGLGQVLTAALALQCAEQGRLDLDQSIRSFNDTFEDATTTVRHVLTHRSEGTPPGALFRYNVDRLELVTPVIEACTGQAYRVAAWRRVLERLAMTGSLPGADLLAQPLSPEDTEFWGADTLDRFASILTRLATPYRVDAKGKPTATTYPAIGMTASAGLIATVRDLALFDAATDQAILVTAETQAEAWRAPVVNGVALPHAIGWFAQTYNGEPLLWQFGVWPDATSGMILKVPQRGLTFILLANSDGLAIPFQLGNGDVTTSLFARLFLRLFIL